jgi:parvulin-like peptidyl-prolyl isomerase
MILFSIGGTFAPSAVWAYEDAIIAVVNDELITLQDLKDYIQSTLARYAAEGMPEQQLRQIKNELEANGIKRIIEDKLILSKANELDLKLNDKVIQNRINDIKSQYPSEEIFLEALVKHGANLSELREKVKDQLKIKYVIQHEVEKKIFVNPQEVTDYYNAHKDEFNKGERVKLKSIFIAFKDDKEASREKAQEAYEFVKDGIDFEETASIYSDTPSIGVVERGQLLPEIEEIIFQLEPGEISPIIEVNSGLYIFKLIQKMSPETANLEEVKDAIYQKLYRMKFQDKYADWLDELTQNAYIEIKSD